MSSEIHFLPAPRLSQDIERALGELTEERVLAPARQAGYELRLVGATVLPQRQTIARTQWGTWLFLDHAEKDPTTVEQHGGRPLIPEDQLARLSGIDAAGADFDVVWIVHQLPDEWQEGDPTPQVAPPRHLREKDERLTVWLNRAWFVVKGAGTAARDIARATRDTAVGFDPIILGGVKHPDAPVVQWCVLAQWESDYVHNKDGGDGYPASS